MKILTLILCLFSSKAFGFSDSLKHEKLIWQLPISGGVSFGGNDLTYKNGGQFALNTGVFVEKKGFLYGIDYFYTEFGDAKNFDKKISPFFGKEYTPTHTVEVISFKFGKHIGAYKKGKFNVNLIGGLGVLKYEYPIIKMSNAPFQLFPNQEYLIDSYYVKRVLSVSGKCKGYFNNRGLVRGFAVVSGFVSSQINFYSVGLGLELNTSK